ncbi:MAG: hypothetical protein RIS29_2620 [Bacteroidota bacterium]
MLSIFMFFALIVYFSHFCYFVPLRALYSYIDPLYQAAMLLVYPLFYIYIRLLTVDKKWETKKHLPYLIIPLLLSAAYALSVLLTPGTEYMIWIYNRNIQNPATNFIRSTHLWVRLTFLISVILTISGNIRLIRKHGFRASEFYSSPSDSSVLKIKILNLMMLLTGAMSMVLGALGRETFFLNPHLIAIPSVVFSCSLFIVGWLGNKQKLINPEFDSLHEAPFTPECKSIPAELEQEIVSKLKRLFEQENIFIYPELTIVDLAQAIGTNRTYLSRVINQHFNSSFSSFVNNYRLSKTETLIQEDPTRPFQLLASMSGFGSVDSLKRTVKARHGLTLSEWKKQVMNKQPNRVSA